MVNHVSVQDEGFGLGTIVTVASSGCYYASVYLLFLFVALSAPT